jgi:hypothetical protein
MSHKMQRVTVPTTLEQRLFGTPITYSAHTAESVRQDLPAVQVKVGRKVVDAMVCGRLNQYATVFVHGYAHPQWTFSWDAIAHSLNSGKPLDGGSL